MVKNETVAYPLDAASLSTASGLTFDDISFYTDIFTVGDFAPEMAVDLLQCFAANCL
jgi:hypothetical protein